MKKYQSQGLMLWLFLFPFNPRLVFSTTKGEKLIKRIIGLALLSSFVPFVVHPSRFVFLHDVANSSSFFGSE
jgi:hypothetical protein